MRRTAVITLYRKEWRGDAGVLAAMVVVLLLVRIVAWGLSLSPHAPEAALCLMAAMIGARLFAGERETGTHAFLMGLPVPAAEVWRAKLVGGLSALVALYVVTYAPAGTSLPGADHSYIFTPYTLCSAPITFLCMALLASSFLDNTMLAFVAGVVFGYTYLMSVTVGTQLIAILLFGREPISGRGDVGMLLLVSVLYVVFSAPCLYASRLIFNIRCRESRG